MGDSKTTSWRRHTNPEEAGKQESLRLGFLMSTNMKHFLFVMLSIAKYLHWFLLMWLLVFSLFQGSENEKGVFNFSFVETNFELSLDLTENRVGQILIPCDK